MFAELGRPQPKNPFTIGIHDDVTGLSLNYDPAVDIEPPERTCAVFFGLGADGTVGANKNTIKIIGEEAGKFAQGYFVYDSKKSGAATISHLRFGDKPVRAPYLISQADFVACHQFFLLEVQPVLDHAAPGGVFLLNAPGPIETLWEPPRRWRRSQAIIAKKLRFYAIDAGAVARACGPRRTHQHHHADLLLCAQPRAAAARRPSKASRKPSRNPTASRARRW